MRYCYNCNKITAGEPLFCNFCGRSYNVKICAHKHINPRNAMACSQCGSRDFSTPQPKVPLWAPLLELLLRILPGSILVAASVTAIVALLHEASRNPVVIADVILLAVLWYAWSQLPRWFREAIYTLLKRRREDDGGRRR